MNSAQKTKLITKPKRDRHRSSQSEINSSKRKPSQSSLTQNTSDEINKQSGER